MSLKNDGKKKLAEYFWMEINKAILTSPEVKLSIKQLQALGLLDYVSEYNLVLEVDRLIDKIVKETDDVTLDELTQLKKDFLEVEESGQIDFSQGEKSSKKTTLKEVTDSEDSETLKTISMPWVDGKLLSDNEMLFEEYLSQEFDEDRWLKKSKIKL
jgi:hypothetical protein